MRLMGKVISSVYDLIKSDNQRIDEVRKDPRLCCSNAARKLANNNSG
jgi:hypothetical protein